MYYLCATKNREDDRRFYQADVGDVISNGTKAPPYLILHKTLHNILVLDWPVRLWLADDAEPGYRAELMQGVNASASYIRTIAVSLAKELSPALLFGEHGEAVCQFLDAITQITKKQTTMLFELFDPQINIAYSNAWNRWIKDVSPQSPYLGDDHHKTLGAAYKIGMPDSAINNGFLIFSSLLDKKARALEGDHAYVWVEDEYADLDDNPMTQLFNRHWSATFDVLIGALMALGAPQYLLDAEHKLLIKGWDILQQ